MTVRSDLPAALALRQMINGFRVSQLIHVAGELELADLMRDGPVSLEDLAHRSKTHAPTLRRLLHALSTLDIFEQHPDGRFGLTALAQPLRSDMPDSVGAYARLVGQPALWSTWGQLIHTVRTGESAFPAIHGDDFWDHLAEEPELGRLFSQAMTQASGVRADAIVAGYDFSGVRTLVDVGGGQGRLIGATLQACSTLTGILFDRPSVVVDASSVLESAGVSDRCQIIGGNFFESVPPGGDVYLLKSIIHDWEDAESIAILTSCRRAMSADSRLLIIERVLPPNVSSSAAGFGDIFMLLLVGGRERSVDEFRVLLDRAGFRLERVALTQSDFSLIEAVPS
jgi:hypothetical protein